MSYQTGFNFVNAAAVCVILESISGLEPSSVIIEPSQVLEACYCLKLLSVYFDLCVEATGVACHQLGLLSTALHAVDWRLCRDAQLILQVFLPILLIHRCHQKSGDW